MNKTDFIKGIQEIMVEREVKIKEELVLFHKEVRTLVFESAKNNLTLLPLVQLKADEVLELMREHKHLKQTNFEQEVEKALSNITSSVTFRSHRQGDYFNIGLNELVVNNE